MDVHLWFCLGLAFSLYCIYIVFCFSYAWENYDQRAFAAIIGDRGIFSGPECRHRCFCGFGKSLFFWSWFWFLCSSSILSIFLQLKHRHLIMKTDNVSSARYVIKNVCPDLQIKKRCLDELSKTAPRLCEFMFTPEDI